MHMYSYGVYQWKFFIKNFPSFSSSPSLTTAPVHSKGHLLEELGTGVQCIRFHLFCSSRATHEEMIQDDVRPQDGPELPSHEQPPILSLLFWSGHQSSADDFQQSPLKISVAISIQEPREC